MEVTQSATPRPARDARSVSDLALDCEALGKLVRQRTLEAVALHFAEVGMRAWPGPAPGACTGSEGGEGR